MSRAPEALFTHCQEALTELVAQLHAMRMANKTTAKDIALVLLVNVGLT